MPNYVQMDMKDSATASSRVYVGGLVDDVGPEELHELFASFGKVLGVRLNRNYGFVQFETEQSAQDAIQSKQPVKCRGRNLQVKSAVPPSKQRMSDGGGGGGGGYRERSPPPGRGGDWGGPDHYEERPPFLPPSRIMDPVPEKNDCEIIVVSKALTEYAEYIEDRLKRLGLIVDLLFPNEDVPIGRVLGNISSRGCLYAVLVMPLNLEHKSLTLNILHGLPQEHRNMPLEDAMALVGRNWAEYRTSGNLSSRAAVTGLLQQLASGHSLTVLQYDTVLKHLKEARERRVRLELGEAAVESGSRTQVDLQQRIMSILCNDTPAPAAAPPVLTDPSVQRAIDSLLNKIT